ncbi:hypothetical protein [Falsiroseomonas sp. E2-1-a20]|uniref:hypothetical protein n=1 Tax=Falsiroseomonas sp. E2-1-a20 TaxID=3239300 RepID=UPI003F411F5F
MDATVASNRASGTALITQADAPKQHHILDELFGFTALGPVAQLLAHRPHAAVAGESIWADTW